METKRRDGRPAWLLAGVVAVASLLSGCAATSVLTFAYEQSNEGQCISAGCAATAVLAYALGKATEGDPTPCYKLNSVERALNARCGPYRKGSLLTKDVTASGLPLCPLSLAARDPALWPVMPELLAKGAQPETCDIPPLVALAQNSACPNFSAAAPESLAALRWLAQADVRSIHHDAVRMLSCPSARAAGLDSVLDTWLAQGQLPPKGLSFGLLSALHPSALESPLARALEKSGHTARTGLGAYDGELPSGFDEALRQGNLTALGWWLDRAPELANRVPPRQGNQMSWVPLVRVITPTYLADPSRQKEIVSYLILRGANPRQALPHDPNQSVVGFARQLKSPSLALLDPPPRNMAARSAAAGVAAGTVAAVPAPAPLVLP
jgi:hypothetical protein